MGNPYPGLAKIRKSYDEAYRAAEYASLTGAQNLISINEVYNTPDKINYPIEIENFLMDAVKYRDREKANHSLDEFFGKILSNEFCTIIQFRKICLEIAAISMRQLFSRGIKREELPAAIIETEKGMVHCARFDQLKQSVTIIINEEISLLDKRVTGSNSRIVNQILQLIDQRIALDLSVETLAILARVTPGYLSTSFKREMGIHLVEYISNARIEKAKQLLRKPELKIKEISLMVGYQDAKYFSHIFKKKTGLQPKDYRNKGL
jgi:two-component system response regulator YesN